MTIIDDYLKNTDAPQREVLEHIRQVIKTAAPEAEEVKTYGMPGFKYQGKYLTAFATFKDHMSLFPGPAAIEAHADELGSHVASKGTVQFTLDDPLTDTVVRKLTIHRMNTIDEKK